MENNHSVSARNMGSIITLMMLSSLLITGFGEVKQDMWISVLAAAVFALPLLLMFSRIASINTGLGLFDIIDRHFGKVIGGILIALLSWYSLHISALVTRNFTEFVSTISLENTPRTIIMIGMIAVAGLLAGKDMKALGRWSLAVLIVVFCNFILTFLLALPSMHFSYIKPVMEHSLSEILSASFSFGMIAFAETFLALVAFGTLKSGEKPYKAYLLGLGWGALLMLVVVSRNIMVLGREMIGTSVFPSYITARVIRPGSFIEHIESVVSFNMILLGITKMSVCIRAAAMGVARILRNEDALKHYVVPVSLLSVALCVTSFSNITELIAFVKPYRYYALIFVVLIPAVIWVKSELGKNRH